MVTREVPFTGNSSLLFSWRNFNAFRKAYEINTLDDFNNFYSKDNSAKLSFDDIEKIVGFGLQRKDKAVSPEEVSELIEEYMEDKTFMELVELVITAQMAALVSTPVEGGEAKGEAKKTPKPLKN